MQPKMKGQADVHNSFCKYLQNTFENQYGLVNAPTLDVMIIGTEWCKFLENGR